MNRQNRTATVAALLGMAACGSTSPGTRAGDQGARRGVDTGVTFTKDFNPFNPLVVRDEDEPSQPHL